MKERNPMPIRKFSLVGIIALSLILLSLVLELFNIKDPSMEKVQTYAILISQILGNILFGVSLLGYFLNLKENKILKWTSLFIGIFYIMNFFTVNNLFTLFTDEFGLIEKFSNSTFFYIYSILVSIDMIFFGYAFSKLKDTNKTIGILAIVFIVLSVYVTAINIFTTQVTSVLSNFKIETSEIMIRDMLAKYKYFNVLSYASLLGIFITLFILQKGMYAKTFKVKVEPSLNEEAE